MRELTFIRSGRLEWRERPDPVLAEPTDALVRPFIASRCDGDVLPIHRSVSRGMQAGLRLGLLDPVVGSILGPVPFQGPFAIGHECVAQVIAVGAGVTDVAPGDVVVVPWAISCGECEECRLGLTAKCATMRAQSPGGTLAAFGFGSSSGPWGGMVADSLRIPHADHMLVRVPDGVDPLRVAAASDNLADAWRSVAPALRQRPGGGRSSSSAVAARASACTPPGWPSLGRVPVSSTTWTPATSGSRWRSRLGPPAGASAVGGGRRCSLASPAGTTWSSRPRRGRRACATPYGLRPGGVCTATGYYLATGTRVPVMDMYATSATLQVGISHVRPVLPELLEFVASTGFPAERVTSLLADSDDAPTAYTARTTKLVLHRPPLDLGR